MKILVVTVGKVRGPLIESVQEYEKRASRYWKIEFISVAQESARSISPEKVKETEASRILSKVPMQFELIALTREGEGITSLGLSEFLDKRLMDALPGIGFIIGGAFGLGDAVLCRARHHLSLSDMTLPHEMASLVLAEQLYRAGTILRGEPYHKG